MNTLESTTAFLARMLRRLAPTIELAIAEKEDQERLIRIENGEEDSFAGESDHVIKCKDCAGSGTLSEINVVESTGGSASAVNRLCTRCYGSGMEPGQ